VEKGANLHQDHRISVERVLVLVEPRLGRVGDRLKSSTGATGRHGVTHAYTYRYIDTDIDLDRQIDR